MPMERGRAVSGKLGLLSTTDMSVDLRTTAIQAKQANALTPNTRLDFPNPPDVCKSRRSDLLQTGPDAGSRIMTLAEPSPRSHFNAKIPVPISRPEHRPQNRCAVTILEPAVII